MPRGNGTGPRGMGPNTGRGMGNCNPETRNRDFSYRGFGRRYYLNRTSNISLEEEKKNLEDRLKIIDSELKK